MNKKKILLIILSVVLVIGLVVGGIIIFSKTDKTPKGENSSNIPEEVITDKNWLKVGTLSELQALIEKSEKTVEYENQYAYVSDISFGEGTAEYTYTISEDGKIVGLDIGYIVVKATEANGKFTMETVTAQELNGRTEVVLSWLSDALDVKIGDNFYIISSTGELLPVEEDTSYYQILNNTASLELRILDVDGSVWVLNMQKHPVYNVVDCNIKHCTADSEEAKIPCNVAVEA